MVVDTDQVRQNKVRAVVDIDGRGAESKAGDLGVGRELFSVRAKAKLEGEELGHAAPEAVAEDDQLVVRKLFEFIHQEIHHKDEDIFGSIGHSHVSLAIEKGDGLAEKVLYDFGNF